MSSVLVAYATKYGSTREIAGLVASTLREDGVDATFAAVGDVGSLEAYGGVVVGAALYNHRWHRDAVRFVSRHREELTRLPVAVFAVGPVNDNPQDFEAAREQLERVMSRWDWLEPVASTVFGGRFDPAQLHFPGAARMLAKVPANDAVDPAAIAAWSHSLPQSMALGQSALR